MNDQQFNRWRWTPIVASIALMILIAVVGLVTSARLQEAAYWRQHTIQVVLGAQTLEDQLINARSRVAGFLRQGRPGLLLERSNATQAGLQELNRLVELTRDNPDQQQRLQIVAASVKAAFAFDDKVTGAYLQSGAETAARMAAGGEGEATATRALEDLQKFTAVERDLLTAREAAEKKAGQRAAPLLVGARLLTAVLLILANGVLCREIARRRRAETEQRELIGKLQSALADVKTLSGLIPICGWCRSVRADSGYWQSVEQYVRANTDASFTHGVCPECAEKFNQDLLNSNCSADKVLQRT